MSSLVSSPYYRLSEVPAGIDEFTHLFGQDDIRLLVDLLKLAVAGRCSDKARESVASLLQVTICCFVVFSE